ncbi:MAG: AAA family ATPase [Anaerolineae bacterium]|jgi:CO dehydrogenase maturation factor|nr:AAA family ATPase [Anaerolineae bacterium]
MTTTIAVAGKGGTGKTTVASMIVRYLVEKQAGSILAIDADPSSNLHYVLGLELEETIGDIREDMLDQVQASSVTAGAMPGGMSKQDYLDYQIRMALVEGTSVDLLAMGRPEGPGCYCAANQMMRVIMDRMGDSYDYVVMDNEAGMEHISRRTTRDVDHLVLVTDTSQRGVIAAQRIVEMIPGLDVNIDKLYLVVNRVIGDHLAPPLAAAVAKIGVELTGTIPNDLVMSEFEFSGRPLIELPRDSPVVQAVFRIADKMLSNGQA